MSKIPTYGGLAARELKGELWKFAEANDGSFTMPDPEYISGLYFPLCNLLGMKSSVTPDFKGDICSDLHSFLTIPTDIEDLHRIKNSRNFWIYVEGHEPWSATGVSAPQTASHWENSKDTFLTAGVGWFSVARANKMLKLKATVTSFVPASQDMVELMKVEVENVGKQPVKCIPTFATPLFGRTADNLRDHRTVTTMFNRIYLHTHGVIVTPMIHHDERGHLPNFTKYAALGATGKGAAPKYIWGNMLDFLGEGGQMDNPEAVSKNLAAPKKSPEDLHGQEGVGAMRWSPVTLKPGQSASFVIILGITEDKEAIDGWVEKFGNESAFNKALAETKACWQKLSSNVSFETDDINYGNWMRWVATQPIYRRVYGNSYLLDFGYGRGGRGWRDLWSDLLSIFLVDPEGAREEIINNFLGIRIDGTNATIVGAKLGEFIADRNNIARTWCDHGAWPWLVLRFYMDQTGDFDVLFKEMSYWKDQFVKRGKQLDQQWSPALGNQQKTASGANYGGTILEHILLELLSSFYHVGQHNNILLDGADWNDTYDGARQKGESVCFTSFYGHDLKNLADTLEMLQKTKGIGEVDILKEVLTLLDTLSGQKKLDYRDWQAKRQRLDEYFETVQHAVSGERVKVKVPDLVADLRAKADFIYNNIRTNEWVTTKDGESFFNGHYDNDSIRVHGDHPLGVRMDLTSQVFPTMFGVATEEQVATTYSAVKCYLRHKKLGGLHLCTNLKELKLNLGRASAYAFGFKEHGGIWNQMNVMFMNALYMRNYVREGYKVFKDVYNLALNTKTSRIFPCIPSFFDHFGRGSYVYLTGSATWLLFTTLTQMFGARGVAGDLCLEPKLVKEQFGKSGRVRTTFTFGGRRLRLTYCNDDLLDWGQYRIKAVRINGTPLPLRDGGAKAVTIARNELMKRCGDDLNEVEVVLR